MVYKCALVPRGEMLIGLQSCFFIFPPFRFYSGISVHGINGHLFLTAEGALNRGVLFATYAKTAFLDFAYTIKNWNFVPHF